MHGAVLQTLRRFGMCGISAQLSPVPDSSGIQVRVALAQRPALPVLPVHGARLGRSSGPGGAPQLPPPTPGC